MRARYRRMRTMIGRTMCEVRITRLDSQGEHQVPTWGAGQAACGTIPCMVVRVVVTAADDGCTSGHTRRCVRHTGRASATVHVREAGTRAAREIRSRQSARRRGRAGWKVGRVRTDQRGDGREAVIAFRDPEGTIRQKLHSARANAGPPQTTALLSYWPGPGFDPWLPTSYCISMMSTASLAPRRFGGGANSGTPAAAAAASIPARYSVNSGPRWGSIRCPSLPLAAASAVLSFTNSPCLGWHGKYCRPE